MSPPLSAKSDGHSYRINAATGLHKGHRKHQEDQLTLIAHRRVKGCLLGVIADGMGGRTGGRKAADQVILTAEQLFEGYAPYLQDGSAILHEIAEQANLVIDLIKISAEQDPHSTMAAFIINPDGRCHWTHIGDSRLYHFRHGQLIHQTVDHSWVQDMLSQGLLSEREAYAHPNANLLTSCLGINTKLCIDSRTLPRLQVGDVLMACSDGLWRHFNNHELGACLDSLRPEAACRFLINHALRRAVDSSDNLSIIIVKIESPSVTNPSR